MSHTSKIHATFDTFKANYPTYNHLPHHLANYIKALGPGNTPCCLQMSQALNGAGFKIPAVSHRRPNFTFAGTKVAPKNTSVPPLRQPENEGEVTITDDTSFIINWNPSGDGETKERFKRGAGLEMKGTSSRYAPLTATKMP